MVKVQQTAKAKNIFTDVERGIERAAGDVYGALEPVVDKFGSIARSAARAGKGVVRLPGDAVRTAFDASQINERGLESDLKNLEEDLADITGTSEVETNSRGRRSAIRRNIKFPNKVNDPKGLFGHLKPKKSSPMMPLMGVEPNPGPKPHKGIAKHKGAKKSVKKIVNKVAHAVAKAEHSHGMGAAQAMGLLAPATRIYKVPAHDRTKYSLRFKHREFVGNVNAFSVANGFRASMYVVNPGNTTCFPWLSGIASAYEQYRFHNLKFDYVSKCSDFNSSTMAIGSTFGNYVYDVHDSPFLDKITMLSYGKPPEPHKPSEDYSIHINKKELHSSALGEQGYRYVLRGSYDQPGFLANVPSISDCANYATALFNVAADGIPVANLLIGELWVNYDVEFCMPQLTSMGTYSKMNRLFYPSMPISTAGTYWANYDPNLKGQSFSGLSTASTFNFDTANSFSVAAGSGLSYNIPGNIMPGTYMLLGFLTVTSGLIVSTTNTVTITDRSNSSSIAVAAFPTTVGSSAVNAGYCTLGTTGGLQQLNLAGVFTVHKPPDSMWGAGLSPAFNFQYTTSGATTADALFYLIAVSPVNSSGYLGYNPDHEELMAMKEYFRSLKTSNVIKPTPKIAPVGLSKEEVKEIEPVEPITPLEEDYLITTKPYDVATLRAIAAYDKSLSISSSSSAATSPSKRSRSSK